MGPFTVKEGQEPSVRRERDGGVAEEPAGLCAVFRVGSTAATNGQGTDGVAASVSVQVDQVRERDDLPAGESHVWVATLQLIGTK